MSPSFLSPIRFLRPSAAGLALAAVALAGCSDSATGPSTAATSEQLAVTVNEKSARRVITLRPPAKAAFPGAHGKASFKTAGQRELEIEIEDARAGLRVVFFLGTQRLGARTVNTLHRASINLRGAASPALVAGKMVKVQTAAGVVVVRGQF